MNDFARQLLLAVAPELVKQVGETLRHRLEARDERRKAAFDARLNAALDRSAEAEQ